MITTSFPSTVLGMKGTMLMFIAPEIESRQGAPLSIDKYLGAILALQGEKEFNVIDVRTID